MAVLEIPIPKAGKGVTIDIDADEIMGENFPMDMLKEILIQGLKTILTRGMADIKTTGLKGPELEKAQAIAMEKAQENLTKLRAGEVRRSGSTKAKGLSGAVKTEAMRVARLLVKDAMKRAGLKVSHYSAKEITALATDLLNGEQGKELVAQAEATINDRAEKEKALGIDLSKIKPDAKLVAASNAKKAEAKATTAAKKAASQVKPRARGEQHANH